MRRSVKDQSAGGTLTIPDGYFVLSMDVDAEPPTCTIYEEGIRGKKMIVEVPRALAYYLNVHHCGSENMRNILRIDAKNELRSSLNLLLEHEEIKDG